MKQYNNLTYAQTCIIDELIKSERKLQAKELKQRTGLTTREIRREVGEMRKQGVPIASGNNGYWLAKSKPDLRQTIIRLRAHAKEEMEIVNALTETLETLGD